MEAFDAFIAFAFFVFGDFEVVIAIWAVHEKTRKVLILDSAF